MFLTVSFNSIFRNIKNYIYSIPIIKNNYNFSTSDKLNFEIRIIFLILILLSIKQVYINKNKLLFICLSTIILHFFHMYYLMDMNQIGFFFDIEFVYYIMFEFLRQLFIKN